MLPLVLPLPLSTEIAMQALMNEASNYSNIGKYKISYELYVEALSSAIKEFRQIEFINNCIVGNDLSSVFLLVNDCLRQVKDITIRCSLPDNTKNKGSPPPIPPKPSKLKTSPPAIYSTEMKRAKSKPEFATRYDKFMYSDDEENEGDGEEDQERKAKRKLKIRKASTPSLKIITNKSKITRRSSTSNISTSAPSSPLSSVSNPFNAVKSFLSLPVSMATDGKRMFYSPTLIESEADDMFLLANGMIDPHVLVTAQTSASDSLSNANNGYVPMIPQAPLVTKHKSLQKQLEELNKTKSCTTDIQISLNRVRNIHMSATTVPTILQFHPVLIAYQLTLVDSTIFRNIPVDAILSHTPKTPHPSIVASTDFFNYLTRLIEHSILLQQEASGRAQNINHWIKVAGKCYELKNYQTLKAVICALGTPPIQRLKRSWQFIPKKSMSLFEDLGELMSETSNYGKYREKLGLAQQQEEQEGTIGEPLKKSIRKNSFSEPTVPFLGIFIHDMTYLTAALSKKKQPVHNSEWKLQKEEQDRNLIQQDARVSELIKLYKNLQRSPPYSPTLSPMCVKDLRKRKLSQALSRTQSMKKISTHYYPEDDGELSIEMQQCLVTQYLLTRSWVSEKTVDDLSLVRESTKSARSYSVPESSATPIQRAHSAGGVYLPPPPSVPPLISSSLSSTTNNSIDALRNSSGSLTSTSSNSRSISMEDDDVDRKSGGFWPFGRKSVDQATLKADSIHRSPKHFSFEEVGVKKLSSPTPSLILSDCRMQREGSQGSLASSIFRKDFWKSNNSQQRSPMINFHSDLSVPIQRKESSSSFAAEHKSTPAEMITFTWE